MYSEEHMMVKHAEGTTNLIKKLIWESLHFGGLCYLII